MAQTKINYTPGAEDAGTPRPLGERFARGLKALVLGGEGEAKPKMGRIPQKVNYDIIGVVVWLACMCLLGGALFTGWEAGPSPWCVPPRAHRVPSFGLA